MRKEYKKPIVKMVDYAYQEQVVAASYPISNWADPWRIDRCTWGDGSCSWVFNVPKGADDCERQGK